MKKSLHVFFILIIGFISCDKSIDYPVTYTSSPTIKCTNKLYTKGGVINDKGVILDFENRTDYFNSAVKIFYQKIGFKATYINPYTVEFSSNNTSLVDTFNVTEKGGLIYWEKRDTSTVYQSILDDRFVFKPLYYYEQNYSSVIFTKYLSCNYLMRNGDDLQMPLTLIYQTNPDYPTFYDYGLVNNKFNYHYIDQMGDGDTIFVTEILIDLKLDL